MIIKDIWIFKTMKEHKAKRTPQKNHCLNPSQQQKQIEGRKRKRILA
jgi:hypothetical protein